ncbi:MAG: right-handed parallel beta-helix repeat-containing protein [Planctomycetota bacterium]|jgi:hypothetical protein
MSVRKNMSNLLAMSLSLLVLISNVSGQIVTDFKEDFETGDFSRFPWEHAGNASWTITSSERFSGTYSAQAGSIGDGEATTLHVTLDCDSGTITFYRRVSCESGYDYLTFSIDGGEKDKWSGEEHWAKASFPVTAGTKTFEWTYSKDSSMSEGDDTAWIDDIVFPIALVPKTAHNPDPRDGARFVDPEADLRWSAGSDAVAHDLYFGNNESDVADGTGDTFKGTLSATTYDPGIFAQDKTYYWRVDEFDGASVHRGDVWSFTTLPEISMTTYDITASSYVGGSGADDSVRGCGIQSDGTVVLAANIGDAAPGGLEPFVLNGATESSAGAIIRLSPDGTTVLSVTRIADLVLDLALDDSDNIYVALWTQGMVKLDPTATFIQWQKERGNVNRIDAGPEGYCVTLVVTEAEPDIYRNVVQPSIANIRVYTPGGSELGNFPGHRMTFDVCIDEPTQTVCHIGWKQRDDWTMGGPVQIAFAQGRTYAGEVLWTSYDWSVDTNSERYLNKSENNMADTRGYRCCIGRDDKLYCVFECAGGNHIFRYDPFDIMTPVDIVGGDEWFEFWNTSDEHKTFIGRYEPATGELLLGQQFCCRLGPNKGSAGNTARVQLGQVCTDELGRVYVGGRCWWGLPLPGHPNYSSNPGQIAFNPFDGLFGGAWLLALNPDFKTRLYCTRLTGGTDQMAYTHAIAARVLSDGLAHIAFGGSSVSELYTTAAIQETLQGDQDGWFAVIPPSEAPAVLYVDGDASGENNGTSWANAFTNLQEALGMGETLSNVEVRVAQGIYKPDEGRLVIRGDRNATFQLVSGVSIKGGYAGFGAPDPSARDIESYKTILSGDLLGNDAVVDDPRDLSTEPTRIENSRHVVTGSGTASTAILDGFTIAGGYAEGWPNFGGGMYNEAGSPTVTNCTFIGNWALQCGAGMCNRNGSSPTVSNCTFTGNRAKDRGGGACNVGSSSPTQENSIFVGNSARKGAGLHSQDNSSPNLNNCNFRENSADEWGGGLCYELNCSPVLTHCIFTGNSAGAGGGIRGDGGNPEMSNCVFSRNLGGGLFIRNSNATLVNSKFSENSHRDGGGICISGSATLTITNCTFTDNSSSRDGGGIFVSRSVHLTLVNCGFNGNTSGRRGAGIYNQGWGGYGATSSLTNCTFSGNLADSDGGALFNSPDCILSLTNCILWGDTPEEIYLDNSTATISYTDIQGGWPGRGNINSNPQFADPLGGDYHLKSQVGRWDPTSKRWIQDNVTSPCIDAGDPTSPVGLEPSSNGARINMGAYGGTSEASKSP